MTYTLGWTVFIIMRSQIRYIWFFICSRKTLKLQIKYFIHELSSKHDLHRSLLGLVILPFFSIIHFLIKIVDFFYCSDDNPALNIGLKLHFLYQPVGICQLNQAKAE